jgi:hypothetical protein
MAALGPLARLSSIMQAPPDLGSRGEVYYPGFYRNFVIRLTAAGTMGFKKGEVGKTFCGACGMSKLMP